MKAEDVQMEIVFKWISLQQDSHWNRVRSINLYPGTNTYFEICDVDGKDNGKVITFEGDCDTGISMRYTIPINEYLKILRDEKLNNLLL